MSRVLYVEVPSFYAAVERAIDPSLAGRPVLVGGDPRRRGVVQDASAEARAAGVEIGMPLQEALQRCPRARPVRTNMRRYREASLRLRACLRRAADGIEADGLQGAYLDGAGLVASPHAVAEKLREVVASELGLPLRVGIAGNRLLARLAAEEAGESGVVEVPDGSEAAFLHPLPVSRLPSVGPQTRSRLAELGVGTVGDLAGLGRGPLEEALGNRGLELLALARGHASAAVRSERFPGSHSQEATLDEPSRELPVLLDRIAALARGLEAALRLQGLAARRVAIKVRFADGETVSRSETLSHAVSAAAEIQEAAARLLDRTPAGTKPARLLGIGLSSFHRGRREDRQLELFPRRS
jgi:nucleotidyltransferase/DNA polymerase involved in DNA repair